MAQIKASVSFDAAKGTATVSLELAGTSEMEHELLNQFFSSRNPNAAQVKLPPKLAAFVKASGLNPTEFALGAVADIKAGKLPKDYLDPDYDHGI